MRQRQSISLSRSTIASPAAWAKFAAMRRASSRVSRLVAEAALQFIVEVKVAERLHVPVADDKALGVVLDRPRRREAARRHSG